MALTTLVLHWGTGGAERSRNLPNLTQLVSGGGRIHGHPALPSISWQNIQPSPQCVRWVLSQHFSINPLAFLHYPGRGYWWLPIPELTPASPGGSGVNPPTAALCSTDSPLSGPCDTKGASPAGLMRWILVREVAHARYHLPWVPRRSCLSSASPGIQKSLKKKKKPLLKRRNVRVNGCSSTQVHCHSTKATDGSTFTQTPSVPAQRLLVGDWGAQTTGWEVVWSCSSTDS